MTTDALDTFAKRLRWARDEAGYSQYGLAKDVGLSRERISQLEAGDGLPDKKKWPKLAHLLSVNRDWLIFGDGNPREGAMNDDDANAIEQYRSLPPHQRKVVQAMISTLAEGASEQAEVQGRPTNRART